MSNFRRFLDVQKLLGFIHTKPGKPSGDFQIIHDGRVLDTNIDAMLNYTHWIKGRAWEIMGRDPRTSIFELITERSFHLRDGHVFEAHVFKTDHDSNSFNVTTTTYGKDGKKFRSETNHFYERNEYLYLVGMLHSVFEKIPNTARLHEDCILVVQTNTTSLSYPSDVVVQETAPLRLRDIIRAEDDDTSNKQLVINDEATEQ